MNLQFLNPPENGLLPTDSHFKVPLYTFVCACTTLIYIKKETRKALQLLDFLEISTKKRPCSGLLVLAEDTVFEPQRTHKHWVLGIQNRRNPIYPISYEF